ncbi:MAG: glutamate--tRNA ligase [Candidatus Hadarchaeales archaeon]
MEDLRRQALRWALVNALEHGGRASTKAVLGKLFASFPGIKDRIQEVSRLVDDVVSEVNSLNREEQELQLSILGRPEKGAREERREHAELPDVEKWGRVVTRFAPNPNGPLHLGHIRTALLSHFYARRHGGKFILRFEDTNPENALLEMYDRIRADLRWMGIEWDEEHVQSDRMELYYDHARTLLEGGKAYVCVCDVESFRRLRDGRKPCPCRGLEPEEHLQRWEQMVSGRISKGGGVVRIKTDLDHPNPAVRDWPALRPVSKPHPRVGSRYLVWPLYNFSAAIDDHEMGITHILRGKEHEVNEERQRTLYAHMGWEYPTAVQHGRLSMPGTALSKTQMMAAIRRGELSGYDDVRLATVAALRRRGFSPEAIRSLIMDIGLTLVDSSLSWETLYAYNRKAIDDVAHRYFFVPSPVKLEVSGMPEMKEIRLRLHPGKPEAGERIIPIMRKDGLGVFYVPSSDVKRLSVGDAFRLKDLMNIRIAKMGAEMEGKYEGAEVLDLPKIQWVSAGAVRIEVLKPDGRLETGLAEPAVGGLQVGSVVQFERYGFVRVESLKPIIRAVYAHR